VAITDGIFTHMEEGNVFVLFCGGGGGGGEGECEQFSWLRLMLMLRRFDGCGKGICQVQIG